MPRFTRFTTMLTLLVAGAAGATECEYEHHKPLERNGGEQFVFFGNCGFYEVGYRLDGNTLYFPRGGSHQLTGVSNAEAKVQLRETYGLIGDDPRYLVRTKDVLATHTGG